MTRHELPAWSPITPSGLAAGLLAMFTGGGAARTEVERCCRTGDDDRVLLTDSGTSALRLALEACARNVPVLMPAYGCYDLATAAVGADVEVALYDVDPETLQPDWDHLEYVARRSGAGALVVAHLYGVPVDLDRARAVADRFVIPLIEDAAQGVGGAWRGRPLGSEGDFAILSFGRGKGRTGGSGGALVRRRLGLDFGVPSVGPAGRGVRSLVAAVVQWVLARPRWYGIPASIPALRLGQTVYHAPWPPAAMPAAPVATLASGWEASEREAATRRARGDVMALLVRQGTGLAPIAPLPEASPGWLRLPAMVPDELPVVVAPPHGVYRGYPHPLHRLEAWADRLLPAVAAFPGATRLAERLLTLPCHGRLAPLGQGRLLHWAATAYPLPSASGARAAA